MWQKNAISNKSGYFFPNYLCFQNKTLNIFGNIYGIYIGIYLEICLPLSWVICTVWNVLNFPFWGLMLLFFFGINKNKHASLILNEHLHQKNLHDRWERVMVSSNKTIYFVSSAEKSFLNLGNSILKNELAYNYSAMASPSPELCAFPKKASKFILLSLCIHP